MSHITSTATAKRVMFERDGKCLRLCPNIDTELNVANKSIVNNMLCFTVK